METSCKICTHQAKQVFHLTADHSEVKQLDIFQCNSCGLLFVGNPLTETQLRAAYDSSDSEKYYKEIAIPTREKALRALKDIQPLFDDSSTPSLLDIGCGDGTFLDVLRQVCPSVRAAGQEFSEKLAARCQAKGLRVFTTGLEEIAELHSVIVALDVAEHLSDPNYTFAKCFSLLKTNGYIYIHTPRKCFWDTLFLHLIKIKIARTLSILWLHTRLSVFHLQLWTDKALTLSLENAGFELVYLKRETELSWPMERYVQSYLANKLPFPSWFFKAVAIFLKVLFVRCHTLRNKAICLARLPAARTSLRG